jgi:hypothetical protein
MARIFVIRWYKLRRVRSKWSDLMRTPTLRKIHLKSTTVIHKNIRPKIVIIILLKLDCQQRHASKSLNWEKASSLRSRWIRIVQTAPQAWALNLQGYESRSDQACSRLIQHSIMLWWARQLKFCQAGNKVRSNFNPKIILQRKPCKCSFNSRSRRDCPSCFRF